MRPSTSLPAFIPLRQITLALTRSSSRIRSTPTSRLLLDKSITLFNSEDLRNPTPVALLQSNSSSPTRDDLLWLFSLLESLPLALEPASTEEITSCLQAMGASVIALELTALSLLKSQLLTVPASALTLVHATMELEES